MPKATLLALLTAFPFLAAHAQSPPYRFTDTAFVNTLCPATGYTLIDNCANEWNRRTGGRDRASVGHD